MRCRRCGRHAPRPRWPALAYSQCVVGDDGDEPLQWTRVVHCERVGRGAVARTRCGGCAPAGRR
eukprot:7225153-Lingulodinium_polyedra.AAC.1